MRLLERSRSRKIGNKLSGHIMKLTRLKMSELLANDVASLQPSS